MTIDFAEQRRKMVDGQLRTTDVTNPAILDAMGEVPREAFVPQTMRALAYIDEDVLVHPAGGEGPRYLMEPSPLAKLLQLADIKPDDVVLDLGCATGYSTAVLTLIAGSVIALESDPHLAATASETLVDLGYDSAAVVEGPLNLGYASEAPYDVIVLNGAVEEVPAALFDQLKDGGRLVGVLGTGNTGRATVWTKNAGVTAARHAFNAAVRPLPGFERETAFEF